MSFESEAREIIEKVSWFNGEYGGSEPINIKQALKALTQLHQREVLAQLKEVGKVWADLPENEFMDYLDDRIAELEGEAKDDQL